MLTTGRIESKLQLLVTSMVKLILMLKAIESLKGQVGKGNTTIVNVEKKVENITQTTLSSK